MTKLRVVVVLCFSYFTDNAITNETVMGLLPMLSIGV
jgi:hypothetical protein